MYLLHLILSKIWCWPHYISVYPCLLSSGSVLATLEAAEDVQIAGLFWSTCSAKVCHLKSEALICLSWPLQDLTRLEPDLISTESFFSGHWLRAGFRQAEQMMDERLTVWNRIIVCLCLTETLFEILEFFMRASPINCPVSDDSDDSQRKDRDQLRMLFTVGRLWCLRVLKDSLQLSDNSFIPPLSTEAHSLFCWNKW